MQALSRALLQPARAALGLQAAAVAALPCSVWVRGMARKSDNDLVVWKGSKRTRRRTSVYYKPGPGSAAAKLVKEAWGDELTSEPLRRSDFLNMTFFNRLPKRKTQGVEESMENADALIAGKDVGPIVDAASGETVSGPRRSAKQERLRKERAAREALKAAAGPAAPPTSKPTTGPSPATSDGGSSGEIKM